MMNPNESNDNGRFPEWLNSLLPWLQWLTMSSVAAFMTWRVVEFLDVLSTR